MFSGSGLQRPKWGQTVLLPDQRKARVVQVIEPDGRGITTITTHDPIAIVEVPGTHIDAFPVGELRSA